MATTNTGHVGTQPPADHRRPRTEPLTAERRRDLLKIVDDRYDKGSLLITSQVPVGRWHDIIGDMTLGDASLDRVVHRAHRLELNRASLHEPRSTPVP